MANLAQTPRRVTTQDRITNNRDAPLPTRRNTELPGVVVSADMRSAYRGNAVDETRRVLGLIPETASDLYKVGTVNEAMAAPQNRATGAMDFASGKPLDPKNHALAYQDAYYTAKAEAHFTRWQTETSQAVDDLINQGGSPAEVQALVQKQVQALTSSAADEYPTANARHALGVGVIQYANKLDAAVAQKFKAKTDEEHLSNLGEVLTSKLDGMEVQAPEPASTAVPAKANTFQLPVQGAKVTGKFGESRGDHAHNGIDLAVPEGSAVGAAAAGEVIATGSDAKSGNFVKVRHGDGSVTSYAHLETITVKQGDSLAAGQELGLAGQTGHATGPHVHFVYRDPQGRPVDPTSILGKSAGPVQAAANVPGLRKPATFQGDVSAAFEDAVAQATKAGIDPKAAKQAMIQSVIRWGTNPNDPRPEELLALANATQRDGKTPSLSPAERETIQNAAVTARGYQDHLEKKQRQDAQDHLEPQLYDALQNGVDMTPAVTQAVHAGVFTATEGEAWASRFKTMSKGEVNSAAVLDLQLKLTDPNADHDKLRQEIASAYKSGQLGTGEAAGHAYVSLMKAARERRASGATKNPGYQPAHEYLGYQLKPDAADLKDLPAVASTWAAAETDFHQKVASGTDPMAAANAVIQEYRPKLDAAMKVHPGRPAGAPPPTTNEAALARIRELAAAAARKRAHLKQ